MTQLPSFPNLILTRSDGNKNQHDSSTCHIWFSTLTGTFHIWLGEKNRLVTWIPQFFSFLILTLRPFNEFFCPAKGYNKTKETKKNSGKLDDHWDARFITQQFPRKICLSENFSDCLSSVSCWSSYYWDLPLTPTGYRPALSTAGVRRAQLVSPSKLRFPLVRVRQVHTGSR